MKESTKQRLIQLAKYDRSAAGASLNRARIAAGITKFSARTRGTSPDLSDIGQSRQSIIDNYQKWCDEADEIVKELEQL
tara:strand:+ start:336 stop:572 length:237 start_codon:yes stop_codon:yes gene_type:complete